MGGHILSEHSVEKYAMFHMKQRIKIKQYWLQATSRRQLKNFSVQQFFKNAAEVWASSPHLRSKSKLHHKIKQKSKKHRKNRNCLERLKVVMKYKVSGAIAIPRQAGDVPQPCRTGFEWFS